jgi:hypothetical protein
MQFKDYYSMHKFEQLLMPLRLAYFGRTKMKRKKIYVSGPMRNVDDYNFPIFYHVSAMLQMWGYDVVNPAAMDIADRRAEWNWDLRQVILDNSFTMEAALARDFREILDCDAIVLLPGWQNSEGANKELQFGIAIGLPAFEWQHNTPINIERDTPMDVGTNAGQTHHYRLYDLSMQSGDDNEKI